MFPATGRALDAASTVRATVSPPEILPRGTHKEALIGLKNTTGAMTQPIWSVHRDPGPHFLDEDLKLVRILYLILGILDVILRKAFIRLLRQGLHTNPVRNEQR